MNIGTAIARLTLLAALCLAACAFLLFAHWQGFWRGWLLPGNEWPTAFGEPALMLGGTMLLVRVAHRAPRDDKAAPAPLPPSSQAGDAETLTRPGVLRFMPDQGRWPTWSLDDIPEPVDPAILGLSDGLLARIGAWDDAYQATFDDDPYKEPFVWEFPDVAAERAWVLEGRAIAEALRQEWGGPFMDAFSGLEDMLMSARRDLSPVEPLPMARAARVARHCRVVEIMDIIERLDTLARDRHALCGIDGEREAEREDGIPRIQEFFARVLTAVDERYTGEVRRGLDSAEAATRDWIAQALEWRQMADRTEAARPNTFSAEQGNEGAQAALGRLGTD